MACTYNPTPTPTPTPNPNPNTCAQTLVHASGEMFWFMILFFNLLLSYCVAFYLCFGMDVAAFSSVPG